LLENKNYILGNLINKTKIKIKWKKYQQLN
jgi:hypothetical protein